MKDKGKGILYIHIIIGTIGLVMVGVASLKYYELVGGVGATFALLGFPFTMIYVHYLEEKAGINKRLLVSRSLLAIVALFAIYFFLM